MDKLLAGLSKDPIATPDVEAEKPDAPVTEPVETPDPGSDPEPPAEAPSLKGFAEKHGLELKDLYALELSGGLTISQLADKGKSLSALDTDRETFEAEQATFRLDQAATQKEVGDLVGLLKAGELTPEGMAKLQAMQGKALESEQRGLLTVLPEWKDTVQRTADVAAMTEHLAGFKLTEHDLAAVADHRWIKYIHFNMQRDARAKAALKGLKPTPKGKGANSGRVDSGSAGAVSLEGIINARD